MFTSLCAVGRLSRIPFPDSTTDLFRVLCISSDAPSYRYVKNPTKTTTKNSKIIKHDEEDRTELKQKKKTKSK